ncbi:MAG: hypothetical protein ACOCWY_05335 [Thermodesulfobacteriota bacterium]
MKKFNREAAISERDQALSILDSNLNRLASLYEKCYQSKGKGALLVYASIIIKGVFPDKIEYRTKKQILKIFDDPASQKQLREMIDGYDPKTKGIMTLITSHSNATFFVTFKFGKGGN